MGLKFLYIRSLLMVAFDRMWGPVTLRSEYSLRAEAKVEESLANLD